MIKRIINVGSDPGNQGDGDTLRDAFIKTQENFDQIFPVTDTTLEHDDPNVEGTIAKALLDAGSSGGGTVLIGPGEFQCPSNTLTIPLNVVLKGSGRRATTILCTHANDGIAMPNSWSGVESLRLRMPNVAPVGDGIKVTENITHLRDISIAGGNSATWAINLDAVNIARIENVVLGVLGTSVKPDTLTGNGIIFHNTRIGERPFNYGDSKLSTVDIHLFSPNRTGIKLHGPDNTDHVINNILMSKVEIHGGTNLDPGKTGIHLINARRNTLIGFDIEAMDTGILEEYSGSGTNIPSNNSYIGVFALGVANSYVSSGEIRDRTFVGCDGIMPDNLGDHDALFSRSLWISNGDLRIKQKGGRFQLEDGNDLNGIQFEVDSPSPTIRTTSTNANAKITIGRSDAGGVECLPGLVLPPQTQVIANPVEGALVYYNSAVVGPQAGLYQYRSGSWVFIA